MPNQFERAAELYRGLQDRVNDLEQSVAEAEGIPNLLRLVADQTTAGESVTVTVAENTSVFTMDSSNMDGGDNFA